MGLATALLLVVSASTLVEAEAQGNAPAAAVAQALDAVREAKSSPDAARRADALGDALRALDGNGETAASAWLREPLTARPPDADRAEQRLTVALELVSGERRPSDPSADRYALERILAGPPFRSFDWESLVPGWLQPAVAATQSALRILWNVVRWPIDRLLDLLARALTYGPVVLLGAFALVAVIMVLYARGLRGALVGQAELAPSDVPLPPTSNEAMRLAQQDASRGHFREASHFLFSATLLWLEERGRFRFEPTATNQEHLASVSGDATVADSLRPFVLRFDRVWYGQEQVTSQDYGELALLAGRLREAVR